MNRETDSRDILIVDDDKAVLRSLRKLLELRGYSVETARTGKEATKKLEKHFCLVALLDIKLPDIEGTELLDVMRKISPKSAKIMLTGYATVENAVESLNKGADAFLRKPINPHELLRVVSEKSHEKLIEISKDLLV